MNVTQSLLLLLVLLQCAGKSVAADGTSRFLRSKEQVERKPEDDLKMQKKKRKWEKKQQRKLELETKMKSKLEGMKKKQTHPLVFDEEEDKMQGNLTLTAGGDPVVVPQIAQYEEVMFMVDSLPDGSGPVELECATSVADDSDVDMLMLRNGEEVCSSRGLSGNETCIAIERVGDVMEVVAGSYDDATDVAVQCHRVEIPVLMSGEARTVPVKEGVAMVFAYQVESFHTLFCEVTNPTDEYGIVNPVLMIPEGPECDNYDSFCSLSTGETDEFIFVELLDSYSDEEDNVLTCHIGTNQELLVNDMIPLSAGELGAFEYTITDAGTYMQCGITASGNATLRVEYTEDYCDAEANEKCNLNVIRGNKTMQIFAVSVEEDGVLECTEVVKEITSLVSGEPIPVTVQEAEVMFFQFESGAAPTTVFCELLLMEEKDYLFSDVSFGSEVRGLFEDNSGFGSVAVIENWLEPNTTWVVLIEGSSYGTEEMELVCGDVTHRPLIPGEPESVILHKAKPTSFRYDVSSPSEITCNVTVSEPLDGFFKVNGYKELTAEAYHNEYGDDYFFSDYCSLWIDHNMTEGNGCVFMADEPQIVSVTVGSAYENPGAELSLLCTVEGIEDDPPASVEREGGPFD